MSNQDNNANQLPQTFQPQVNLLVCSQDKFVRFTNPLPQMTGQGLDINSIQEFKPQNKGTAGPPVGTNAVDGNYQPLQNSFPTAHPNIYYTNQQPQQYVQQPNYGGQQQYNQGYNNYNKNQNYIQPQQQQYRQVQQQQPPFSVFTQPIPLQNVYYNPNQPIQGFQVIPQTNPVVTPAYNLQNVQNAPEFKPAKKQTVESTGMPISGNQQFGSVQPQDQSNPSVWTPDNQPKPYQSSDFRIPNTVITPTLNVNSIAWMPTKKQPAQQTIVELAPTPFSSTPAPIVIDPLTKKLKEELKLPDEQLKSLKELLDKISAAKNDAETRFKLIKEDLKNSAVCKDVFPAANLYWHGQMNRQPEMVALPQKSFTKGGYSQPKSDGYNHRGRGRGHYNQDGGAGQDGFAKGVSRPYQRDQREPQTEEDQLKRGEADQLKKKLWEESKQVIEKAKSDKNTQQKIRLIVNVITPDNFDKKFEELRVFMFGDHKLPEEEGYNESVDTLTEDKVSNENLQIIVETVFRKAQNEREYCIFYGDLCQNIIKLELNLQKLKATNKNIKNSQFRKLLLKNCKNSFEQFFTEDTKKLFESKDEEKLLKFKQRLFGNINFVGELFRRGLLQESIILSVFDMLMVVDTNDSQLVFVNDNTVEGAVVLMEKIGHMLDTKLQNIEAKESDKPTRPADVETAEKIRKTFARFEEFRTPSCIPQVSTRQKMLILNMMDNRKNDWERTKKSESGPMKVEELRQHLEKKLQEEQRIRDEAEREEQSYLGGHQKQGGRGYNGKSQTAPGQQYQKKDYSSGRGDGGRGRRDDYKDDRKQGGRGDGRSSQGGKGYSQNQYVKKPANQAQIPSIEITDVELEKKISQNFTAYVNELEEKQDATFQSDFFQVFDELQKINGRNGSEIFYSFLNKIFDRSEQEIDEILPRYLTDLWKSRHLGKPGFQDGMSKFLTALPNIACDYPRISEWLAKVLYVLNKENAIKFDRLVLNDKLVSGSEAEDDQPMVEDYYRLMSQFLLLLSNDFEGPDRLRSFFQQCFDPQFKLMKPLIMEEGLFDEIEKSIMGQRGVVIRAILEQDDAKYQKSL